MSGELEAWCEVSEFLGLMEAGLAVPLLGLQPGAWLIDDQQVEFKLLYDEAGLALSFEKF